ncbi:uncharacterized protein LOC106173581 [Lingula anatina]|uniref:Uncharacterized protein LOC106173581 n=1 Tax=Lingula anatina TaxID=7574 RepID=A0A1S3JIK5_LINAN|nr:uncharacterized protein LOC106173581 [Lingula anatina]|eukprot:XP_013410203.1 uncharacterized protein LOC106173581 [Lingula anatina]
MAVSEKTLAVARSFKAKLDQLGCPFTEDVDVSWILELIFKPGEPRIRLLQWLFSKFDSKLNDMLDPQLAATDTKIDSRIQRLLFIANTLGLCRYDDVDLIRGVASQAKQISFMDQLLDLVWIKDTADDPQLRHMQSPGVVSETTQIDDQFTQDCWLADTIAGQERMHTMFSPKARLLPPDLMKSVEQSWKQREKKNPNCFFMYRHRCGVASQAKQISFMDQLLDLVWIKDTADDPQLRHMQSPGVVSETTQIDDQFTQDCWLADTIAGQERMHTMFSPKARLLPPDLMKSVEQSWKQREKKNPNCSHVPDITQLVQMSQELSRNLARQTEILNELKAGYHLPEQDDALQDKVTRTLRLVLSELSQLVVGFSYVFENEMRQWCNKTPPSLTELGPAFKRVHTMLQQFTALLQGLSTIRSSYTTVCEESSERTKTILNPDKTAGLAYVSQAALDSFQECVSVLEETMRHRGQRKGQSEASFLGNSTMIKLMNVQSDLQPGIKDAAAADLVMIWIISHFPFSSHVPDITQLVQMSQELSRNLVRQTEILNELKAGYHLPEQDDALQDKVTRTLRLVLSELSQLVVGFSYVFENEMRQWCNKTPPSLTELGPAFKRVHTMLQQFTALLQGLSTIRSSYTTVCEESSERTKTILNPDKTAGLAYVSQAALDSFQECVFVLEETMRHRGQRKGHSEASFLGNSTMIKL